MGAFSGSRGIDRLKFCYLGDGAPITLATLWGGATSPKKEPIWAISSWRYLSDNRYFIGASTANTTRPQTREVVRTWEVDSARLTHCFFHFFSSKKKKKKKNSIVLRPQPSGRAPHGYGGAKGRSSLKSRGFSPKFGEGVPKVWRSAARKLSQSLAGRLKRSNSSSYAPRTYPALGFWLPTPRWLPGSELLAPDSRCSESIFWWRKEAWFPASSILYHIATSPYWVDESSQALHYFQSCSRALTRRPRVVCKCETCNQPNAYEGRQF